MRVKHLLDLITEPGYRKSRDVWRSRDNLRCPVAVCVPDEGDYTRCLVSGETEWRYGRYTPKAYYAVLAWQMAYDAVTKGNGGYYDVEWRDVSEGFRTVRYVRKPVEALISEFRAELKRIVESGSVTVRFGRYDYQVPADQPNLIVRDYVMDGALLRDTRNHHKPQVWESVEPGEPVSFTWAEVENCFVDLLEIEVAFLLGEDMRRCTEIDEGFLKACEACDVENMRRLLDAGANMYATDKWGGSAATAVVEAYDRFSQPDNFSSVAAALDLLVSRGYDLDFCGYADCTPLYQATYADDRIVELLLSRGADPNVPCWIASSWSGVAEIPYEHASDDKWIDGDEDGSFERMQYLLLQHGSCTCADIRLREWADLDGIAKYDDPNVANRLGAVAPQMEWITRRAVEAAQHLCCWGVQLAWKSGANLTVRDARGRGLIRVALEDAKMVVESKREHQWTPDEFDYAEFVMLIISGFGVPYTREDERLVEDFCTEHGYERMRTEIRKCKERLAQQGQHPNKCPGNVSVR